MIGKPTSELAADVRLVLDAAGRARPEQHDQSHAALDALVARVTDLEDREENLCERISICDIKLAKREARVADLEAQVEATRGTNRELTRQLESAEAQVAALTQSWHELDDAKAEANVRAMAAESALATARQALEPFVENWDFYACDYLTELVDGEEQRIIPARVVADIIEAQSDARRALAAAADNTTEPA